MKLTWDNIDDYKLTRKGDKLKHKDKRGYYYLNERCKVCKEPYISTQKHSEYCSSKCKPKNTGRKHSFEDVKNFVESIPLKLLSNDYENNNSPLEVQCPTCGYIWYPSYANLKKGQTGCVKCLGKYTPSWNDVINLFDSYGFELLSKEEEFKSANHSKLRFKCKKCDYESMTTYTGLKSRGRKCEICNDRNMTPFTFEEIKKWFEDEEWVVHSTKEDYKSQNTTPIDCSCPNGHRQLKSVRKWRLGRRCVHCNTSGPELAFRKEIEKLNYEVIFNDRKTLDGLELDFYFPEINKAIEFNGDFWHCNYDRYDCNYFNKHKGLYASELWVKDAIKRRKCKKNGIDLITIWDSYWQDYKEDTMNHIQTFLKD